MAANFRLHVHRKSDSVHLKLAGDFDCSSAHELANAINYHCTRARKVFIHTNELKSVHPFGCKVFKGSLSLPNPKALTFIFTGQCAHEIGADLQRRFLCRIEI